MMSCFDFMLQLQSLCFTKSPQKIMGGKLFFPFYGSFNSSYCVTARHLFRGNQWQTGIKVEKIIRALVFCQTIQGGLKQRRRRVSFCTVILLTGGLYWVENEHNSGLEYLHWRYKLLHYQYIMFYKVYQRVTTLFLSLLRIKLQNPTIFIDLLYFRYKS